MQARKAPDDPFLWLEDGESEEVKAWTRAQNERTRAHLDAIAAHEPLRARVRELLRTGYVMPPLPRRREGGWRYFWTERRGDAVQPTLFVRDDAGPARALLDVASLSSDGTDALDWWYPSRDGSLLAWGRSRSGSEKSELYLRDVETGVDRAETIPDTRHASVAWVAPDRFFYTRYPPGRDLDVRVHEHVIGVSGVGRSYREDPVIFGEGRPSEEIPSVSASPCGRWVVIRVHQGWEKSEIHVLDRVTGSIEMVAGGEPALFEPIPTEDALYVMTTSGAPRWRLFRAPWTDLSRREAVLPEREDVLVSALPQRDRLIACYLRDAASAVLVITPEGTRELDLGVVSADVSGDVDSDEVFVMTHSFVSPTRVFRLRDELEEVASVAPPDLAEMIVERREARSKDGTRVPMFVVRRADLALPAPALISGYGGFNVSQTPAFSVRALAAVERGLVFVSTVLRGGGEFGEAWHEAGMRERKQNVFDDFLACAEALVTQGIAAEGKIAAIGGSNGGLLVAAACTQRPELFRAGVALVPLTDMLRYHLFRIGRLWIPEYGDPDVEADLRFLHAYSPYHQLREGTAYPTMFFATAEADSRVDPMHARKMTARMQALGQRVFLRVEEKAGHGQGKPTSKLADEVAGELAFVLEELR